MRAVIVGAGGQLGQEISRQWPGPVVAMSHPQCDLTWEVSAIRDALAPCGADICINCAAYNWVDQAEHQAIEAWSVNAWGVRKLAQVCLDLGIRLVHISTDYVFGLDPQHTPLTEEVAPGPVNLYGLSKLMGEYLARQVLGDGVLIVRTCGLYGHRGRGGKGRNFVETMLRLVREGRPLRVVDDQRCTPSYAGDVAAAVIRLIERGAYGLYHVVNSGDCTWYQFAQKIFELMGLVPELRPIPSSEYPAVARRPSYSVLSTLKMQRLGLPPLRPWQDALAAYLHDRQQVSESPTTFATPE